MSLDPKVRQSLAAVSGESVAMCFGRDIRAVLAALDEAEFRAEKAEMDQNLTLSQIVHVKRERDMAIMEREKAERERDAITMAYINDLTYVECETNKKVSRFRARLARPHGRIEVAEFDTEAEAVAAVRKAAGLEDA
jgi:hypothetical protein